MLRTCGRGRGPSRRRGEARTTSSTRRSRPPRHPVPSCRRGRGRSGSWLTGCAPRPGRPARAAADAPRAGSRGRPTPVRTASSVSSMSKRRRRRAPLSSRASWASRTAMGPVWATASASLTRDQAGVCRASAMSGRALGLAEIAALVAPGLLGRAERADEVVHELEGESEPTALRVECSDRLARCAGEQGARAQRSAEGVHGRLVERRVEDRPRPRRSRASPRSRRRRARRPPRRRSRRRADRTVRLATSAGDIGEARSGGTPRAAADRRRGWPPRRREGPRPRHPHRACELAHTELTGDVRDAAAHRVVVDHVVVHHERGVQQLERGRHGI